MGWFIYVCLLMYCRCFCVNVVVVGLFWVECWFVVVVVGWMIVEMLWLWMWLVDELLGWFVCWSGVEWVEVVLV